MITWIRKKIQKLLEKIFGKKVSLEEYAKELKSYNKSQIIKEIVISAQQANHNQCGVESGFQKELRKQSKKDLVRTLLLLKVYKDNSMRGKLTGLAKEMVLN